MSDIGDLWRDFGATIVPHIKATRAKRLARFHRNLRDVQELAGFYGISIKVHTQHHIQILCREYIGNYYPSTRKFYFQRPQLMPTITGVSPEHVLSVFLRHALQIESMPEVKFNSWWSFDNNDNPHREVLRVGDYLMPHVRTEVLRLGGYRPDIIDLVDPIEFEQLIAELLCAEGWDAKVTQASSDEGKDIIALKHESGHDFLLLVECKRWLSNNVGIDIIQRAVGVKYIDHADHSMIVTTANFTKPAHEQAKKVVGELTLVDRELLTSWLRSYDRIKRIEENSLNA